MTDCSVCKRNFPNDLLNELAEIKEGKLTYTNMCPLCGLAHLRKATGRPDEMFIGPRTVDLYERAIAHLKATNQSTEILKI